MTRSRNGTRLRLNRYFRYYFEDKLTCVNLEEVANYGISLEEFAVVAKCNNISLLTFRPTEGEFEVCATEECFKTERSMVTNNNILDLTEFQTQSDTVKSVCVHRSDFHLFEQAVLAASRREHLYLAITFDRRTFNQHGSGHFGMLAALNPEEKNVLFLETANYKYPSFWGKLSDFWNSLFPKDEETNLPRGFFLCSVNSTLRPLICRTGLDVDSAREIKKLLAANNKLDLLESSAFKTSVLAHFSDFQSRCGVESDYTQLNVNFKEEIELFDLIRKEDINTTEITAMLEKTPNTARMVRFLSNSHWVQYVSFVLACLDKYSFSEEKLRKESEIVRYLFGVEYS